MSTATLPPGEVLETIAEAVEAVTGYRPHPTTACRWHRKGVRGVKLKTVELGGRPRTCRAWVQAFIDATTAQREAATT